VFEAIIYAIRKWEQTGKPDFNIVFNFVEKVDGMTVAELLGQWIIGINPHYPLLFY
jgi:hypothetical protein